MDEHLGYGKHEPVGRNGGNSRNGRRSKTLLTEVGKVEVAVPRDRDGTFTPAIVAKRQRRFGGIDELVISLTAKGLTTGEVAAHLAEVYDAQVSKDHISTITERVMESFAEWQNRPLDPIYPVRPGHDRLDGARGRGAGPGRGLLWREGALLSSGFPRPPRRTRLPRHRVPGSGPGPARPE